MGVGCPCPPVRNDIVTPRHLFFYQSLELSDSDINLMIACLCACFILTFHVAVCTCQCIVGAFWSLHPFAHPSIISPPVSQFIQLSMSICPSTQSYDICVHMFHPFACYFVILRIRVYKEYTFFL